MDHRKILLAVDGSSNAMRAVEYVGTMLGGNDRFLVELVYVERPPDRDTFPDEASWRTESLRQEDVARQVLDGARQALVAKGFNDEALTERFEINCRSPLIEKAGPGEHPEACSSQPTVSENLLRIQQEEGFGTIVVGKRSITKAEEFLFGSVSSKLLHAARGCALWVVA
jgi:nucleotide-binding universal stress UspA family protein